MRKLCTFAVGLVSAVFLAVYLLPGAALIWLSCACAAVGIAGIFVYAAAKRDAVLRTVLAFLGLGLGFAWCWGYDAVFLSAARSLDGQTMEVSATLDDWPETTDYGGVFTVRVHVEGKPDTKARLYWYGDAVGLDPAALKPGDDLTFTAKLRLADRLGGQDSDYYFSKGISLSGSIRGEIQAVPAPKVPLRYWPLMAAKALKESIAQVFSPDTVGFAAALFTGDKGELDGGLYAAMRRTGAAHVVAVSGLHVSFLAGLLTVVLGKNRRSSALLTMAVLFFFALMAGASPSALRSVWLQAAMLAAPLLGRENDPPTSLFTILMLLLLANPYAAASISLQLSFAAVAGIYLVVGRLNEKWTAKLKSKGRPWFVKLGHAALRFAAGSLAVTCGALIFTTPLMALYFRSVSLISPVTNLLTLWAVSDGFLLGMIAAVLGVFLPGVASLLAWAAGLFLRYVQWAVLTLAKLPYAAVPSDDLYIALWLLFAYAVLLTWALWRGRRGRIRVPLGACAVTLAAAVALSSASRNAGELRVSVLDVGQGASALFSSGGQLCLVDCGGTGLDDPGDVAADQVQAMGRLRLDYLVLTHYHADHAGGVARLMARLEVGTVLLPDVEPGDPLRDEVLALARDEGAEVRFVTSETDITLGHTNLRLYPPMGDGGVNEEGLSLLASCGEFRALVTGDMNSMVEKRLVKYADLTDLDLLVAGHHGSARSTSEELLRTAWPEYAAISVGYNSYGHPASETMERLGAAGCKVFRTDQHGTITVTYHGG